MADRPLAHLTAEDRAACEAQGCTAWTQAELEALVRAAMLKGIEAAQRQRGSI